MEAKVKDLRTGSDIHRLDLLVMWITSDTSPFAGRVIRSLPITEEVSTVIQSVFDFQ